MVAFNAGDKIVYMFLKEHILNLATDVEQSDGVVKVNIIIPLDIFYDF